MIKIIRNLVAIVPIENPDKIGSIIVPDMAKERLNQGFVKYRGPDTQHCKIGDYVLFSGYTGTLTYIEGEGKLIIMPEDFIVATMERIPEIEIAGVYFRDHINTNENIASLTNVIAYAMPDLDTPNVIKLAEVLCGAGVIGPAADPYFPGTYETIMAHIAATFSQSEEWRDSMIVRNMELLDSKELDKTRTT